MHATGYVLTELGLRYIFIYKIVSMRIGHEKLACMHTCYFLNGYTYNHSKVETIFYEFLLMGYPSICSFRYIRLYQVC